MLRVGIAGCGWAGMRHAEAITGSDRATVAAVADTDGDLREQRKQEWGAEAGYAGYAEMLSSATLDAVVIALPHALHEDAVAEAAEHGVAILCEKPIARTVAEADRMVDAATSADVPFVVAESARYTNWTQRVEEVIRDGRIGRPAFVSINWLHNFGGYGYDRAEWLNDPEQVGGGQWILNGVHLVSPARSWLRAGDAEEIETVFAREFRTPDFEGPEGIEASVHATLASSTGETVDITLGLEVHAEASFTDIRIVGTEGAIRVDADREQLFISTEGGEPEHISAEENDAFVDQMAAFIDTVLEGTPSPTSGLEERNTLAVIEAGYRSIDTGESVRTNMRTD